MFQLKRSFFSPYSGIGLDGAGFVRVAIHAADLAALGFGIDVVRIGRVFEHPEAVAAEHVFPARVADAAGIRRIAHPGAVVLQAAIDVIGVRVVHADVIELRDRQVHLVLPARSAIFAAPQTAIIARIHNVRIRRIDPDVVKIAVRRVGHHAETLPAIHAEQQNKIGLENLVLIFGIDDQIGEIKRPPHHELAGIQPLPGLAAVIGAEQRAVLAFDLGIHHLRLARRHRDCDSALRLGGKALAVGVGQFRPVHAAVGGFVEPAARTARAEGPTLAAEIPQ